MRKENKKAPEKIPDAFLHLAGFPASLYVLVLVLAQIRLHDAIGCRFGQQLVNYFMSKTQFP